MLWCEEKGNYYGFKRFAGDQKQKLVFARAAGMSNKSDFAGTRSDESCSCGENTMFFCKFVYEIQLLDSGGRGDEDLGHGITYYMN